MCTYQEPLLQWEKHQDLEHVSWVMAESYWLQTNPEKKHDWVIQQALQTNKIIW